MVETQLQVFVVVKVFVRQEIHYITFDLFDK